MRAGLYGKNCQAKTSQACLYLPDLAIRVRTQPKTVLEAGFSQRSCFHMWDR